MPQTPWRRLAASRVRLPRAGETKAAESATTASSSGGGGRGGNGAEVYQGVYGPWQVTREDELEVLFYRLGLTATAAGLAGGAACAALGADAALNPLAVLAAAGLGVSTALIHVYVTPLKRFLQVTWAAGAAGGAYLLLRECGGQPLPLFVADHPWAVWLVGPYFASLTGVAVKEGLCYGKPEAAAVAALLPTLLLGHLSGLLPPAALQVLLAGAAGATAVFAARKYTQPVKDDIGDKSIFEFRKLPREEQERVVASLRLQMQAQEQRRFGGGGDSEGEP